MFELLMLPVEEQEKVAVKLHVASRRAEIKNCIVIHSIKKIGVTIDELKFAHQVQYDFRCSGCKQMRNETVNLYGAVFKDWCEYCLDKAEEYRRDQALESMSGSDEDNDH